MFFNRGMHSTKCNTSYWLMTCLLCCVCGQVHWRTVPMWSVRLTQHSTVIRASRSWEKWQLVRSVVRSSAAFQRVCATAWTKSTSQARVRHCRHFSILLTTSSHLLHHTGNYCYQYGSVGPAWSPIVPCWLWIMFSICTQYVFLYLMMEISHNLPLVTTILTNIKNISSVFHMKSKLAVKLLYSFVREGTLP